LEAILTSTLICEVVVFATLQPMITAVVAEGTVYTVVSVASVQDAV